MRRYHFDLVDINSVTDAGGALLVDDNQARKVARDLVQEVRESRPHLIGHGYGISVRGANGAEVFRVEIDAEKEGGR